jgi:hypothetical protein
VRARLTSRISYYALSIGALLVLLALLAQVLGMKRVYGPNTFAAFKVFHDQNGHRSGFGIFCRPYFKPHCRGFGVIDVPQPGKLFSCDGFTCLGKSFECGTIDGVEACLRGRY